MGIIGGGPSGTFCALALLSRASHAARQVHVTIFDRRPFTEYGPRGCNMCAGVISHSVVSNMRRLGITIPRDVVQREIEGYRLVTRVGEVHLKKPPNHKIYTAYRGRGPRWADWPRERSFDNFLLRTATGAGAEHVPELVTDVVLSPRPQIVLAKGEMREVDVVIGAFGVNSPMPRRLAGLAFGYRPPRTATACQAEIPLDADYISETFRNEITIFALGLPRVKFAALTPKEEHLTVTLIGERVRRTDLEAFLEHPFVRPLLPAGWQMPDRFCSCSPRFPISRARCPVTDNLAVVGDAHIARYFKNGLESAFWTATLAADAVLAGDRSADDLRRRYATPCRKRFGYDNACGRGLFLIHDVISRLPLVTAAHVRAARREQTAPASRQRLTRVLWQMFTGDAPYASILRNAARPGLQLELAMAVLEETARRLTGMGAVR